MELRLLPRYPSGEHYQGSAARFPAASAELENQWAVFLSTEADFQAWRDQRDWTDRNMRCEQEAADADTKT
jgi:hypothetical protein